MKKDIEVRPATLDDLDQIMRIEDSSYVPMGDGASASKTLMQERIVLCNNEIRDFFWVAERENLIVAYMIVFPVDFCPEDCTSWEQATGNGSLSTFEENGKNMYVASFGKLNDESEIAPLLLVRKSFQVSLRRGSEFYMFAANMPGLREQNKKTGISPDQYWQLIDEDGLPLDPALKNFSMMTGDKPIRLLRNGFPPDRDSLGHAVFYAVSDINNALKSTEALLNYINQ